MAENFVYSIAGAEIMLPKYSDVLTFGFARRNRHLPEAEVLFLLVEENATPDVLKILDRLNMEQTREVMTAWAQDSGVSLGESASSSTL